ncbi:sensor histidine kinase [Telluribacter sp.]|jgi:two-component system CheB/CheR fusion protein|uniref:sensor histidine kinase n=1 Tax=Telluribacter sp. TaxID=1978767 RepID=UPI002E0D4048|nr:ATP-binding protein [Telluribacter sp.]
MSTPKTYEQLVKENEELLTQLEEANETIDAIRSGQVDALVVKGENDEPQLYTLKTADQTYRVFIEKMNEGAVTLNEEGIILYSNSMFSSMIGLPLSRVVGMSFESLIPDNCKEIYQQVFSNGWVKDSKAELSIISGDGQIPCQLSVTTLQLDEGKALSVILTDLTFQKETQALLKQNNERLKEINVELEISNHDLQQFASVASHDLQEPLRKILIFSTMLRNKEDLSEESLIFLDKIISSSSRMKALIIDILTYSRLSTNTNTFILTNLADIIEEIREDYEIVISETKATIVVEDLPEMEVNRGQIKQVFQNLISNSIKFSKAGQAPEVRITSCFPEQVVNATDPEAAEPMCCITVSDNGIGFDKVYNEKIFSLFERLNSKDKFEGSGIGLAITKKIIEKHKGNIKAISREGEGAQFLITLPLRQNGL